MALALALACGFLVLLEALDAHATPIRPDIRKIISEQQQSTAEAMPARAGWDGPEMPATPLATGLATPDGLARAERAELFAAATPDPRAILGIAALIFLLRLLKQRDEKRVQPELAEAGADSSTTLAEDDRLAA